jgi:hypothetical protein
MLTQERLLTRYTAEGAGSKQYGDLRGRELQFAAPNLDVTERAAGASAVDGACRRRRRAPFRSRRAVRIWEWRSVLGNGGGARRKGEGGWRGGERALPRELWSRAAVEEA